MVKITLCKNGVVRIYGLNPTTNLKRILRKSLNTRENKFLRGFVNSI